MRGICSALLVPFDESGNLHEPGLRQVVRHNIDTLGVDGLYVGGSSGENFMLSSDTKKRVFGVVAEEVRGGVFLIAQVGSLDMDEAVELARYTTELGYSALSAVTPFYYKYSFQEIARYYELIASASENSMILYYFPGCTGVVLGLEEFSQLLSSEHIIGVKFTASDFFLLERLRTRFPDKLIYCGFDEMLLSALVLGVDGAIGSTYNVDGHLAKQLFRCVQEKNLEEARRLQRRMNAVSEEAGKYGELQALKEILRYQSVDAGYCRPPFAKLMDTQVKNLHQVVDLNL